MKKHITGESVKAGLLIKADSTLQQHGKSTGSGTSPIKKPEKPIPETEKPDVHEIPNNKNPEIENTDIDEVPGTEIEELPDAEPPEIPATDEKPVPSHKFYK